tara:strand:- start:451 stop:1056 length:606 start_codon:yes stop_codon:yes gene_type:complete
MAFIIDGNAKVITLTTGTTSVSVRDLWSRWVDWFLTGDNGKYLPAFTNTGGDDIDPISGTSIPIYAFLVNGWKLKPQESNHTLTVQDGVLLVNGGGDPFNNTNGAYTIRINYQQPVQAITVATGGGSGSSPTVEQIREEIDLNSSKLLQINNQVEELWRLQGLDILNPLIVNQNNRTTGDIVQGIITTGTGETQETIIIRE